LKISEIPINRLQEAHWNVNSMDEAMLNHLKDSVSRYGTLSPLVIRKKNEFYEVLSGNQRLRALRELNYKTVPCVVVDLDDAEARLLAQALNAIHGEDDWNKKAEIIKQILTNIPERQILTLLPETAESLKALSSLNTMDMSAYLEQWQQAQTARLRNVQLRVTNQQLATVERALDLAMAKGNTTLNNNPNLRGNAFYLICQEFLKMRKEEEKI
jgi:ParB family transcriptional regulator, chromosome partitioning protein